jgi:hypothetical protein
MQARVVCLLSGQGLRHTVLLVHGPDQAAKTQQAATQINTACISRLMSLQIVLVLWRCTGTCCVSVVLVRDLQAAILGDGCDQAANTQQAAMQIDTAMH